MEFAGMDLPESVLAHYGAISFSDTCLEDLRRFIEQHPTMSRCSPIAVKKVVKVGSRIAQFSSDLLSTPEYERLHQYAHEAIRDLALGNAQVKLQAHLYGDAADITRTIYRRTKNAHAAHETGADYLLATKRTTSDDIAYRLGFLCKLAEFGIERLVHYNDEQFARIASEELEYFPLARVHEHRGMQLYARHLRKRLRCALPR